KLFSVDGTAWETVWESRTPPDYSSKSPITIFVIGLFAFGALKIMVYPLLSGQVKFYFCTVKKSSSPFD
ncbi:hypothetical protein, partial [Desulfobacula sp.]|uniref:hypothetical protein n=1 Tax=Desulfobacula sp. TaxID=2593537 RepID=UPI0039B8A89E